MRHDEGSHQACADTPGSCPDVLQAAVFVGILNVETLCEVLPQEVGRACLQGFSILHHGLDGEGVQCTCKALIGALVPYDYRECHCFAGEFGIHSNHLLCLGLSFFGGCMGGMAFLPEEFRGAEEQAGAHFPADDVAPLVAQDGKVPPGVDPVLVGVPDDGFGCGTDDEFLLEPGRRVHDDAFSVGGVHQAVVGHHGAFLGESGDMLGLAAEEGLRNEEREVGVLVTGLLEHSVQDVLHFLPYGVSVGFDDHAAAHGGLLGEIRLDDQVVVPLGIVILPSGYLFCHNSIVFFKFCP